MYSYSHLQDAAWMGEFPRPSEALIAGRANYDPEDAPIIYVAKWKQLHYSDIFFGGQALISFLRDHASDRMDDADLAAFDALDVGQIMRLGQYVETAIGEWESELPAAMRFSGRWIEHVRGYRQGEEVRPGHFPAPL